MIATGLRNRFRGVFGFPVTPFDPDLSLDLKGLARNVNHMARHPFCALVAAGGTSELYSLTVPEGLEVVRVTVEAVAGRMPVVAGVGFNAALGAELARGAEKAGADCLLVLPPYYANPPEEGLFDYYAAIGRATPLPLIIYSRDWPCSCPSRPPAWPSLCLHSPGRTARARPASTSAS